MGKVFDALTKAGADAKPVERQSAAAVREDESNSAPVVEQRVPPPPQAPKSPQARPSRPVKTVSPVIPGNWDERFLAARANPAIAESFRRLRAKIIHPQNEAPVRSVLVTSAAPGEGKSFVCANLGTMMAHGVNQHALLVDCDLRRPGLDRFFGIEARQGLVDHLSKGADLADLIMATGQEKLSLLPAGIPPANPSELLASQAMSDMIREVVERYQDRFVVFDSPPAQAASETAVLAQHVDKVVLVVRWGRGGREQVKKLVEQLGADKILGVVFNAFEMNFLDKRLQGEGYGKYYTEGY